MFFVVVVFWLLVGGWTQPLLALLACMVAC